MRKDSNSMMPIILVVIALFYSVILFVACGLKNHGGAFWLSYVFMIITILMSMFTWGLTKNTGRLLGFTFFFYAVLNICLEFVLSGSFIALEVLQVISSWPLAFIPQVVLLGAHIVVIMLCAATKQEIEDVEIQVKTETQLMKVLRSNAAALAADSASPITKDAFEKLSEEFKYSDPRCNPRLIDMENRLLNELGVAKGLLEAGLQDAAVQKAAEISKMLAERNRICKLFK